MEVSVHGNHSDQSLELHYETVILLFYPEFCRLSEPGRDTCNRIYVIKIEPCSAIPLEL